MKTALLSAAGRIGRRRPAAGAGAAPAAPAGLRRLKATGILCLASGFVSAVVTLLLGWSDGSSASPTHATVIAVCIALAMTAAAAAGVTNRATIAEAFRHRADSEHEQIIIRVVFTSVVLTFLVLATRLGWHSGAADLAALAMAWGVVVSWLFLIDLMLRPGVSRLRRVLAQAADLSVLSVMLLVGGEPTAALFPIYFWVTFGNGFRYGNASLASAAALSVAGFGTVVLFSPYWSAQPRLAAGLLLGLILLPLYVSTLIRKLNAAKTAAEEASIAKSRFVANMSHELRTPLTAIIGTSGLLEGTTLSGDQRDLVRTVHASGETLLSLINDILDFSKIEAAKVEIHRQPFDLHAQLAGIRAMLVRGAVEKDLHLDFEVDPDIPPALVGDAGKLSQVVVNLLGNALKFTASGGVRLSATRIGDAPSGTVTVRIAVVDTGIGIAREHLDRIFESFTQADDAINRRFGGTGLGLAIARQLVEMQGGRMGVDSQVGVGSTFWFELPFAAGEIEAHADPFRNAAGVLAVGEDASRLRALVAGLGLPARIVSTPAEIDAVAGAAARGGAEVVVFLDRNRDAISRRAIDRLAAARARETTLYVEVGSDFGSAATAPRRPFAPGAIHLASRSDPVALLRVVRFGLAMVGRQDGDRAAAPAAAAPARVLLVEDNATNRRVIARMIESFGHTVTVVADGDAALDAMEAGGLDVVLMDVNMPGTSGLEATKLFRFMEGGDSRLPIIGLTADATEASRARCREAGMDAFLTKPIDAARLAEAIAQAVVRDGAPAPRPVDAVARDRADGPAGADPVGADTAEADRRLVGEPVAAAAAEARDADRRGPEQGAMVTPISAHPNYQIVREPTIDVAAFEAVRALSPDDDFAATVIREFLDEAADLVDEVAVAQVAGDGATIAAALHSLRSSAGYIGARRLEALCSMPLERVASESEERRVSALRSELATVGTALGQALIRPPRRTGGHG